MEDDKSSEENVIFANEIKDTGNYLIKMGTTFIDRATAMEVVASSLPHSEQHEPLSEEDDIIYISTEHVKSEIKDEDDKSKIQCTLIPFKKEKKQMTPHLHPKMMFLRPNPPISLFFFNIKEQKGKEANMYTMIAC